MRQSSVKNTSYFLVLPLPTQNCHWAGILLKTVTMKVQYLGQICNNLLNVNTKLYFNTLDKYILAFIWGSKPQDGICKDLIRRTRQPGGITQVTTCINESQTLQNVSTVLVFRVQKLQHGSTSLQKWSTFKWYAPPSMTDAVVMIRGINGIHWGSQISRVDQRERGN